MSPATKINQLFSFGKCITVSPDVTLHTNVAHCTGKASNSNKTTSGHCFKISVWLKPMTVET